MKKNILKQQVISVLRDSPRTRNSDIHLTIEIWKRFYNDSLILGKHTQTHYISIYKLFDLPREDHIKRVRAKIQNEDKKYLPTDFAIFEARAKSSKEWRKYLGYYSKQDYLEKLNNYHKHHYKGGLFKYENN